MSLGSPKAYPGAGWAVSVAPWAKVAVQVPGQSMPAGWLVTLPLGSVWIVTVVAACAAAGSAMSATAAKRIKRCRKRAVMHAGSRARSAVIRAMAHRAASPHSRQRSPEARATGRATAARTASSVPTRIRRSRARVTAV